MESLQSDIWKDEQQLGSLAMRFRGTRVKEERAAIANAYGEVVERLIRTGHWEEMPSAEDQLPDDWMPEGFFEYWGTVDEET